MNVTPRTDLLRPTGMNQPPILGLNGPSFMQNSSQSGPQSAMGLPPNAGGGPMGMLPGSISNSNPGMVGRSYPMPPNSMVPQGSHRIPIRPGPGGPPLMNGPGGSMQGTPHMGNPSSHQLGNMNFPSSMMPPGAPGTQMRRAVSQPQNGMGHVGGLHPGVNGGMNMGMGINASGSVPPQMRPQHPQAPGHNPMRHMQPDMAITMSGRPAGNGNMGNVPRPGVPIMNSLGQPPNNSSGMPGGMPHQNNFQNNMNMPHQPPHSSSPRPGPGPHAPTHNPNMSMGAPGPSQPPVNRARMTPDNNNFMNFPNTSFPSSNPGPANRMPGNNTYPMIPSTPPNTMNEMPQPMPGSMGNTPSGTPNRPNFNPTPAQQFESMQQNGDNFVPPFGISRPNSIPTHPPQQPSSQQPHHHSPHHQSSHHQSPHHHSPHPSDLINIYPPRPQSQPQNPTGRPSSAGTSQTPRPSQPPPHPPNSNPLPAGRIPPQQIGPNSLRPASTTGVPQAPVIAPRPPNQPQPPSNAEPSPTGSSSPTSDQPPQQQPQPQTQSQPQPSTSTALSIPRAVPNTPALGHGVGLIRLLQFSGILANESKQKLQLSWWNDLIREYFTPKAIMRFTLWKDNQRNEAKPFEIGVPILPRFFLATTQSGVKSMTLTLDGARERLYAYGHAIVECVSAVWTYKYNNGYIVALRGPLTVHVVLTAPPPPGAAGPQTTGSYSLKFEDFQFDALMHDKYIALDSIVGTRTMESPRGLNLDHLLPRDPEEEEKKWEEPKVMIERGYFPGEPVNAFGIPQATMRCLELAESVAQMSDLIAFSCENGLGPKESLVRLAHKIRETMPPFSLPLSQPTLSQSPMVNGAHLIATGPSHFAMNNQANAISLYTSAPASVTNPNPSSSQAQGQTPSTMTSTMSSPQNAPVSANSSPRKGHKTIPGQGQAPPPTTTNANPNSNPNTNANPNPGSVSASGSTPGSSSTTNTPAMGNASLKRKQVPESPAQANADTQQPPTKRTTRKRGRTNG